MSINANSINEATLHYAAAAVHVYFNHRLVLEDTDFYNNTGGGVYANNSDIILVGLLNIILATLVEQYSWIVTLYIIVVAVTHIPLFSNSSHTIIANNRALEYGGGIGVSKRRVNPTFSFHQIQDVNRDPHGFIDNHADVAGDDIHGIGTMQCQLYANNYYENNNVPKRIEFDSVLKGLYSTLSSVIVNTLPCLLL